MEVLSLLPKVLQPECTYLPLQYVVPDQSNQN